MRCHNAVKPERAVFKVVPSASARRASRRTACARELVRGATNGQATDMAPTVLIDSLAEAEAYIIRGERHIRQQRELVAELEREGRDATAARKLLAIFEDLRRQYLAERDRLLRASARERLDGPHA